MAGVDPRTWAWPGSRHTYCPEKAGLTLDDIDLIELNEAFGSALACERELKLDREKVNVHG